MYYGEIKLYLIHHSQLGAPQKEKKIRGPRARAQCAHWLRRPWHSQHTKHAITWAVHRKRSHLGVLHACDAPDSCPNVKSTACARHLKQLHQPPPPTTRQYLCFSCFGGLVRVTGEAWGL